MGTIQILFYLKGKIKKNILSTYFWLEIQMSDNVTLYIANERHSHVYSLFQQNFKNTDIAIESPQQGSPRLKLYKIGFV